MLKGESQVLTQEKLRLDLLHFHKSQALETEVCCS